MRRLILLFALLALVGAPEFAQQAAAPAQPQAGESTSPTIRANSRLVVVDVVVTDSAGKPVTDLKPEDFTVEENGKSQKMASVELVNGTPQAPETLPDTVYSNRPEFNAPRPGYTIMLIDALNTPIANQAYARQQLLRYVDSQLQPGHRIAVYALGNSLYKLQNFTDDPMLLKSAIEKSGKYTLESNAPSAPSPSTTPGPTPGSTTLSGVGGMSTSGGSALSSI